MQTTYKAADYQAAKSQGMSSGQALEFACRKYAHDRQGSKIDSYAGFEFSTLDRDRFIAAGCQPGQALLLAITVYKR